MSSQDEISNDEPSKLGMLVAEITHRGTSERRGAVHALTVRIPTVEMSYLQAISKYSGMSLNKTIVQFLEVAIDLAHSSLSRKEAKAIQILQGEFVESLSIPGELEQATGL